MNFHSRLDKSEMSNLGGLYLTIPWRFPLEVFEVCNTSPLKAIPFRLAAGLQMTSISLVAFTSPVSRSELFIKWAVRIRYPALITTKLFDGD